MESDDRAPTSVASPSVESPVVDVHKHEKYYFDDGSAKILVDNVLYNVYRGLISRQSAWFRERFEQPIDCLPPGWTTLSTPRGEPVFVNYSLEITQFERPSELPIESLGSEGAIRLYGVSVFEFDALLAVLIRDNHDELDLTKEQWISVLKLSTLWSFLSVRTLAIRRLGALLNGGPLERLSLARAHSVHQWVDGAFEELVEREQILDEDEMVGFALTDVIRLAKEREIRASSRVTATLRNHPLGAKVLEDMEEVRRKEREQQEKKAAEVTSPLLL